MSDSEQERDNLVASDEEEDFDNEDDEEEEEEEEEDDDEDVPAKSSKNKRKPQSKSSSRKRMKNIFLDEAEVAGEDDEDEEEDEEEEGYEDHRYSREAAEAAQAFREIDSRRRNASNYLQELSAAEIVEDVTARYRQQHRPMFADGAGGYDMAPEVTQQSLLPRSTDPSLWVVRCKPGSEQPVVLSLMRKALDFKANGKDLGINSAFSTASKGYIYIEASHEASAREAINGLNLIQQFTMKKLPLSEMTAVLTIRQTRKPLAVGQWARYKRGPYKGDLCKVLDVIEGGDRVVVQVVPRLDYSKLKIPGARALATTLKEKYPQKFFNATECSQSGGGVDRVRYPGLMHEACDFFEANYFRQGYLLKEVKPDTTLTWENVQPTIAELQQFRDRKEQEDDDDADEDAPAPATTNLLDELAQMAEQSAAPGTKAAKFQSGDMVQVISGDLINLIGKIEAIDEVTGAVTLEPRSAAFQGTVQVTADQLIKHIEVGGHIKVLGGVYAGNTGTVVAIEELEGDYICVVLTDGLKTELKVNISDVVETSEVTTGLSNLAGYELYDLVVLGQNETAVVVAVGTEHVRVVTHQSIEKQVRPQELRGKRNVQSLRATALDNVQNTLQEGDIVTVVKGNFAKKTGTIKHIHKGTLWLHSNSHHKNAGIFVVRSRSCMLSGTRARAAITNMRSGAGMRQGGAGMGVRQSNDFKDMTVQITKGPYKGLLGRVMDANDTHLRVELNAKLKKVMIEIDKVVKVGDRQGALGGGQQMRSSGPLAYPMGIPDTPAIIAETPRHIPDTPLHTMETPSHDAMPYTPSRPTTPAHDSIWRPTARPIVSNPTGVSDDYGGFRPSSDQAFHPIPSTYGSTGTGYQSGYSARAYSHSPYGDASSMYTPSYGDGFSPNPTSLSQAPADIAPSEWPANVVLVFKSGPEVGSEVKLIDNLGDNMRVKMPDGRFERVPARELGPANPQRKDTVIVLSGSYKGLTGILKKFSDDTGVDESDVYVKPLDGSPPVVVPKLSLGKLAT